MTTAHTDELIDLLDAGGATATIVARLAYVEASTALLTSPGWTALLARLLVVIDREAARRGRRVSIDFVREKWGALAVCAGVVDRGPGRGAAWLRRIVNRFEIESESRCTTCSRRAPPDASPRWRASRCARHSAPGWTPASPRPPDLSAHARLRALVALDARGPWRIARTYDGDVWRLPVRRGRHDALVSVRADEVGAFVTAAITAWRGGPVRLGAARLLAAEARLEAAASSALGLAPPPAP